MATRQCGFCGETIGIRTEKCPHCYRDIPPMVVMNKQDNSAENSRLFRRGLLYMLMAGVFYYLTSDQSPFEVPFTVPPLVDQALVPLLFLSGLLLALFGLLRPSN